MALALLAGPANAGKVARLLDRYVEVIDREPFLVVPSRADVDPAERDLLQRVPALLGARIGTFDDLFARVRALAGEDEERVIGDTQRRLLLTDVVRRAPLNGLGASARFAGFVDALAEAFDDLGAGLVDPGDLDGDLARLYDEYRRGLERLGLRDGNAVRRRAAELAASDLAAWDGAPVLAYGFEDLTGAEWALLEALAGRTEVLVSLPYQPGRAAFAALERTAGDLAALASGRIEELAPQGWYEAPALAYLERALFQDRVPGQAPALDGAVRFLEAAGTRAAFELAGEDVLALLRSGVSAEEIGVVVPSVEGWRAPLESAFTALGVPYALDGRVTLGRTGFGRALAGLLRFAWLSGGRRELYAFLRSPYSGLARARADFAEGRLRGRAVSSGPKVEEETVRLLGHGIPALDELHGAGSTVEAARAVVASMLRAAYGLESPPAGEGAQLELRAREAARRVLDELDEWASLGGEVQPEAVVSALERAHVRPSRSWEPGRVQVLDLMRARTRRFRYVFLFGLEEGVVPRRAAETPFLPDERRAELDQGRRGRRLARPDQVARDRYLFYTACTRAWRRLTLVREAAGDEGRPREPSPFWDEVRTRFAADDVARWTRRRPLSALVPELEHAPTERARLRAAAVIGARDQDEARALARANGWERRIERALAAFQRQTRLVNPVVQSELAARARFSVTEVEQFGDCSSMWLFERAIAPKELEAQVDARLRGQVAHQTLYRFYSGLPKRLGVERVQAERLEEAHEFLRECLADAIAGGAARLDLSDVERFELEGALTRDLEQFLRREVELGLPLEPRRFEVSFGSERAATELQRGLELGDFALSGKIDRIDVDPFSARGIVQDYKLGEAHSAARIESEARLQIPLYVLALRDLVGIEPLGGVYRSLSGKREARGLLRASAREDAVPGFAERDYLDEDEFWAAAERAKERAARAVERIRRGDVAHDPRWGSCPSWCDLWAMCRVKRA